MIRTLFEKFVHKKNIVNNMYAKIVPNAIDNL